MKQIQKTHLATLIKYLGISFITGALSHGFFTGERQVITAIIGVALFSLGTLLLREKQKNTGTTLLYSVIFAISLWAFTGGLQHFPDSPERSMLIVPLGFVFSVYSFYALEQQQFWKKQTLLYTLLGTFWVLCLSALFYIVVEQGYLGEHSHAHETSVSETGTGQSLQTVTPEIWEADVHEDTEENHAH